MKIAILICGQLRNIDFTIHSFNDYISDISNVYKKNNHEKQIKLEALKIKEESLYEKIDTILKTIILSDERSESESESESERSEELKKLEAIKQKYAEERKVYEDLDELNVFIATQDLNCIKPRLGCTEIVNQYILNKINYDIPEKLQKLFGSKLKSFTIRQLHTEYSEAQGPDLIFKNTLGWAENFKDLQICIDLVKSYEEQHNITHDLYIKTRPDIIYCDKLKIPDEIQQKSMYIYDKNDRFIWDTVFYMDPECLNKMTGFYDFYMKFMKVNLDKCLNWSYLYNCEDHLFLYTKIHKITTIQLDTFGYPMSWMISDIKNMDKQRRFDNIQNKDILRNLIAYSIKCQQIIVDLYHE